MENKTRPLSESGYRMPAEWVAHRRCWMCWPDAADQWGDGLRDAERGYAAVARAIRRFEPVTMVANPGSADAARRACGPDVDIVPIEIDDAWARDSGPSFLRHSDGRVGAVGWRFNAWGGKSPRHDRDARLARRILDSLGLPLYESPLTVEGGALHVDGEGTVITTESVVLNPNRNPGISRREAERLLCRGLGADKVIWLPGDPDGLTGDMTDGHVDGLMAFVRPGVALFESDPSAGGALAALARENRRALETATDARGRRLEIVAMHDAFEAKGEGESFCRSYVNFYVANGGIVMPRYGIDGDAAAREVLARSFPDREIVQVDVAGIAPGGGGIHCITQQQPI